MPTVASPHRLQATGYRKKLNTYRLTPVNWTLPHHAGLIRSEVPSGLEQGPEYEPQPLFRSVGHLDFERVRGGVRVAKLCRKHRVSGAGIYKWKAKFSGMEVSEVKRLRTREEENMRLKRLLADAMLDDLELTDLRGKKR